MVASWKSRSFALTSGQSRSSLRADAEKTCPLAPCVLPGDGDPSSVRDTFLNPTLQIAKRSESAACRLKRIHEGLSQRSPYATHGCRAELAISSMVARASWTSLLLSFRRIFPEFPMFTVGKTLPRVLESAPMFAAAVSLGQISS